MYIFCTSRYIVATDGLLCDKNAGAWVSMVSYLKKLEYKREKKFWEPFRNSLLNSTANSANNLIFKSETIETNAPPFLSHINSYVATVFYIKKPNK